MKGRSFGHLTVIGEAGPDRWGQMRWRCLCACGVEHVAVGGKLRREEVTSCGCAKPAACAAANIVHGASVRGRMTPEYRAWQNMIYRCENSNAKQWKDWGGRGITVWSGWRHSFARFLADVGQRPSPAHTIDRIDNAGHYAPGNVRWATRAEQNRNKRNLRMMTVGKTTMPLIAWAEKLGIHSSTILMRLRAGWSEEKAVTTPNQRPHKALRGPLGLS